MAVNGHAVCCEESNRVISSTFDFQSAIRPELKFDSIKRGSSVALLFVMKHFKSIFAVIGNENGFVL